MSGRLLILRDVTAPPGQVARVLSFDEFRMLVRRGGIVRHILKYPEVTLRTPELEVLPKPLMTALVLRALSRGTCVIEDERGARLSIGPQALVRLGLSMARDALRARALLRSVETEVRGLEAAERVTGGRLELAKTPVYLRTDLWFGIRSGGSVGHIAGVLNSLDYFADKPVFLTTDRIATVRDDLETFVIRPEPGFSDFVQLPTFAFNDAFTSGAQQILDGRSVAFVYQRYGVGNYSGVVLARHYRVPFVLEYNGSEIWINRHWGRPLKYEALSARIELLNLRSADVVVVVSEPMKDELVGRGIDPVKILVNPNGVDPERYTPDINGHPIRARYGLVDHLVVGFIGTFGPWHGSEVLADGFASLVRRSPDLRDRVRLLLIGDGPTLPDTRRRLEAAGVLDLVAFAGRTPQAEGPAHLAACDILASPHIPNADGTPFFGSPTKLFEYMAMGKAIVASDLDQIGEVLEHDRTAWLVRPGDPDALAEGVRRLAEDADLRARLGSAAREEVVANYTWHEHTRRIIEKLESRCA